MLLLSYLEKSIITHTILISTGVTIIAVILSSVEIKDIKKIFIKKGKRLHP
jgi:hypothetical protein